MNRISGRSAISSTLLIAIAAFGIVGDASQAHALTTKRIFVSSTSITRFQLPTDFNPLDNTIEVIGAGGNGGNAGVGSRRLGGRGGAGGGAGAYTKIVNAPFTRLQILGVHIGQPGSVNTWVCTATSTCTSMAAPTVVIAAQGGSDALGTTPGKGGLASAGIPATATRYSGGTGGTPGTVSGTAGSGGAGGAGAAGPHGTGVNGANTANAASTATVGGNGGAGDQGFGGIGGTGGAIGSAGTSGVQGGDLAVFGAGGGGGGAGGAPSNTGSTGGSRGGFAGAGGGGAGGFGANVSGTVTGGGGSLGYVIVTYTVDPNTDHTPPTPAPSILSVGGGSINGVPYMGMTAGSLAQDPNGVEYNYTYVPCATDNGSGGVSSGWQTDPVYMNTVSSFNACYAYTVQARDQATTPNYTATSSVRQAYSIAKTPGQTTLGNPTNTTLSLTVDGNGNPSVSPVTTYAVQVTSTDAAWNAKYVDAAGNPTATEVWLSEAQFDAVVLGAGATPLLPGTTYQATTKAMNHDGTITAFGPAGVNTTTNI